MQAPEQLLAQAMRQAQAGDFAAAATTFEQAALVLGPARGDDAASALLSAARLRMIGEDLDGARAALDRGEQLARVAAPARLGELLRVRAELADRRGDRDQRIAAWRAVRDAGDATQQLFALTQLGTLARDGGDPAGAAALFAEAVALAAGGDPLLRAELRLEQAISVAATGAHDPARQLLDAIERDLPADDDGIRARVIGQRGVLAYASGDLDGALGFAEQARAAAVARNDVTTYLAASSLITMVHEAAGRPVDAYDTLIRARTSLGDLLGPDGAALIQPALTLFEQRLGAQLDAVHAAWVARRTAARG